MSINYHAELTFTSLFLFITLFIFFSAQQSPKAAPVVVLRVSGLILDRGTRNRLLFNLFPLDGTIY